MYSTTTLEGPHYSISFENTFMKIGISLEINDKTFAWPNQMPWILTWKAVCDIQQQQLWFSIFPHPDSVTYIFIHPFSILFNLSSDSKMRTNNWKWVITGEFPPLHKPTRYKLFATWYIWQWFDHATQKLTTMMMERQIIIMPCINVTWLQF